MNKQSGDTSFPSSLARSWLIFSTAGLFVFYQLILQSLPSVIRDGLVVDFSLSQSGFGALSSSFYYPYMFLQVPAGLLVVRFGARRLLIAGISLCTLASFLSAFSQEFFWVETARILMGLGAAPTFVCTMALVTRWFPPTLLPILVALTETLGMLGAALGQEILGFVVQVAGWRTGMALCGWFGLLIFFMILLFIRNSPGAHYDHEVTSLTFPPRSCGHDVLSPAHTYRARWRNDLQCWTSVCYALGGFVFSGTFGFEPCQSVLLRIALFVGDYCWSSRFRVGVWTISGTTPAARSGGSIYGRIRCFNSLCTRELRSVMSGHAHLWAL